MIWGNLYITMSLSINAGQHRIGVGKLRNMLNLRNILSCTLTFLGNTLAIEGLRVQLALTASRKRTQFTSTQVT